MPFCLWVTKAESYRAAHEEAVRALSEPLGPCPPSQLLDAAALDQVLEELEAQPHPSDGAFWVRYPEASRQAGQPWFSLFRTPRKGPLRHVELSASYSNPQFIRNMLDMFDFGLALAQQVGGRLFEETAGREITAENIDAFLELRGEFVTGQHRFWRQGQEELWAEPQAPLEFPLGAIDQLTDYLQFKVRAASAAPPLEALVAHLPAHLEAKVLEHSAVLIERQSATPVVRLIRFEDGAVVRPYWSHLPFSRLAGETFRAVERLEQQLSGAVEFGGAPAPEAVRAELERHAQGLGVEFYEWLTLGPVAPVAPAG